MTVIRRGRQGLIHDERSWLLVDKQGCWFTQNSQNSKTAANSLQREGLLNNLLRNLPETFVETCVNSARNSWLQTSVVGTRRNESQLEHVMGNARTKWQKQNSQFPWKAYENTAAYHVMLERAIMLSSALFENRVNVCHVMIAELEYMLLNQVVVSWSNTYRTWFYYN